MSKLYVILVIISLTLLGTIKQAQAQGGEIGETKRVKSFFPYMYKRYETPGALNFPVKPTHKTLVIRLGSGNFSLTNHDKNEIEVEAVIRTVSLSKRKSTRFIQEFLRLSVIDKGDKIFLKSKFSITRKKKRSVEGDRYVSTFSLGAALGTPGSKIHISVKIPSNLSVKIDDQSGSIEVRNLANPLKIVDHSGGIVLENLTGKLRVYDGAGNIRARQLKDSVYIKDGSGGIDIEQVSGVLIVNDRSGDIHIQGLEGDLELKDASGNIVVKDVSNRLKIRDTSGNIELDNISYQVKPEAEVIIRDKSGNIYLKNVHGKLNLRDRSGKVYRK